MTSSIFPGLSSLEGQTDPRFDKILSGRDRSETRRYAVRLNKEGAHRMTNPQLQDHLYSFEERLLHPDREHDRTILIPLFADEFKEFCISGRIFSRQQVIDALLKSEPRPATISNYYIDRLAENVALATYSAKTALVISHRSSLWIFRDNRWQLFFHQGTIAG